MIKPMSSSTIIHHHLCHRPPSNESTITSQPCVRGTLPRRYRTYMSWVESPNPSPRGRGRGRGPDGGGGPPKPFTTRKKGLPYQSLIFRTGGVLVGGGWINMFKYVYIYIYIYYTSYRVLFLSLKLRSRPKVASRIAKELLYLAYKHIQ